MTTTPDTPAASLSGENWKLVGFEPNVIHYATMTTDGRLEYCEMTLATLNRLLDAAREQGRTSPAGDGVEISEIELILRDTLTVGRGTLDGDAVTFVDGIQEAARYIAAPLHSPAQPVQHELEVDLDAPTDEEALRYLRQLGDATEPGTAKRRSIHWVADNMATLISAAMA